MRVECPDAIGHPIVGRDLCDEHAERVIARARVRAVEIYWRSVARITSRAGVSIGKASHYDLVRC